MTLHLLIVLEREKVDERLQEARLNDRRLVLWVDRHVPDTSGSREDERQVGRLKQPKQGGEAISLDNLELILLWMNGLFSFCCSEMIEDGYD